MPVTISLGFSLPQAEARPNTSASAAVRGSRLSMEPNVPNPCTSGQLPSSRAPKITESQQVAAGERAAHLGQRLLLELADPLARQVVLVADLLERELLLGAQAEALAQDVGLDRPQLAQQVADLGGQRLPLEIAGRRYLLAIGVLEHLAEHA